MELEIPSYYDSLPVKTLGDRAGAFYRDFINFNDDQYYTIRNEGSSVLTKGLTMPLDELRHLISWASNGKTPEQIASKVDSYIVEDLHWAMDATYDMALNTFLL